MTARELIKLLSDKPANLDLQIGFDINKGETIGRIVDVVVMGDFEGGPDDGIRLIGKTARKPIKT